MYFFNRRLIRVYLLKRTLDTLIFSFSVHSKIVKSRRIRTRIQLFSPERIIIFKYLTYRSLHYRTLSFLLSLDPSIFIPLYETIISEIKDFIFHPLLKGLGKTFCKVFLEKLIPCNNERPLSEGCEGDEHPRIRISDATVICHISLFLFSFSFRVIYKHYIS